MALGWLGLAVLVLLAVIAAYALTTPAPGDARVTPTPLRPARRDSTRPG